MLTDHCVKDVTKFLQRVLAEDDTKKLNISGFDPRMQEYV